MSNFMKALQGVPFSQMNQPLTTPQGSNLQRFLTMTEPWKRDQQDNIFSLISGASGDMLGKSLGFSTSGMSPLGKAGLQAGLMGATVGAGNAASNPSFLENLSTWFGKGGIGSNILSGAGQVAGLIGGIMDMRNSRKMMKSNLESMALSREMARENLKMQREEYARLKANRAGISAAYSGRR